MQVCLDILERMKVAVLLVLLLSGLAGTSCRQRDIRTTTILCPKVMNEKSSEIVFRALSRTDGVQPDSIRFESGKVTVTYDSMKVAIKNLEYVIAEAGFDAGEFPADPKAREALPEELR